MKKNILKATLVAAFAIVAGYNVHKVQDSETMSDIVLANVDALAEEAVEPGCKMSLLYICETSDKDYYLYRNK